MVRSMYSGVSGMKAHQARMDVIGNNIANVNTYGFKASRASFRDVYYQTMNSASAGSSNRGGTNPSAIGYGSQIGSVDVLHTRSSFAMTDNGMDVAIAGEGFFQVQDTDGNTFYTRSGMMNVDSAGNLVDMMGNFILGVSGDPLGKAAGTDRIQLSIPSVLPTAASTEETINNVKFKITATNTSKDGNVTFNFDSKKLPIGQKASAQITTSGISIILNSDETFANDTALTDAINAAITAANGGKAHPAGKFTLTSDGKIDNLTGAQIVDKDFSVKLGEITGKGDLSLKGGISLDKVGEMFSATGSPGAFTATYTAQVAGPPIVPAQYAISMTVDGKTYTGTIQETDGTKDGGQLVLKNGTNAGDEIIINHSGFAALVAGLGTGAGATPIANGATAADIKAELAKATFSASEPSKNIGLSSRPMKLMGGTMGGAQTVKDLSSIGIGADGIIEAIHPVHGRLQLGRVNIVTFENPQGLEQAGNTYFIETANSGKANWCDPGSDGSGALASGSLEMSNVDLSREFSDMITTQRGFQANSRLITVSDEMLNELVNLKR